jgi:Protein of unknwon function (DUF3310)
LSEANKRQVGGRHYKTNFEHWDLVLMTGMNYFQGQATRYICRWRKKDGLQDLEKALHYIDKMAESPIPIVVRPPLGSIAVEVLHFAIINGLNMTELMAIMALALLSTPEDLEHARGYVLSLMAEAEPKPVPLTEENHYTERADDPKTGA